MDFALRVRLSVMMFLQYFLWGSWGVVIFGFIASLPTEGGLNFSGDQQGWIGATLPIGAMISPLFIGLFADRLFATEKVLVLLHLAGAVLLGWAAYTCTQHLPEIKQVFESAAREEQVGESNLLAIIEQKAQLQQQLSEASGPPLLAPLRDLLLGRPAEERERLQDLQGQLQALEREEVQKAIKRVNERPQVQGAVQAVFIPLFSLLLAYAFCYMPTITLTNSLSFRNLSNPDKYFGGIRVLGTIGWIGAGWVVAFTLNAVSVQPLYVASATSVLLGLFCFALPHTPPTGGAKTLGDALGVPALAMLRDISFLVFFVCSFLITIVLAFYFQQAFRFVSDLKAPYPAFLLTLGQISEIFFMLAIPIGLSRLGTKGMLVVGMLAWCLRYAIFATRNVPAVVALGLPLHGICYDFFFVVSYLYVDRQAPKHLRASAQGMITFVTLGVGMFLGNLLAGRVVEIYTQGKDTDWTRVWLVPLVGSVAATALFAILFREPRTPAEQDVSVSKALEGLEPVEPPEQVH